MVHCAAQAAPEALQLVDGARPARIAAVRVDEDLAGLDRDGAIGGVRDASGSSHLRARADHALYVRPR